MTRGYAVGALACTQCAIDTSTCGATDASLVAWYRFEDTAGSATVSDSSGNANDGSFSTGGFTSVAGVIGNALDMGGGRHVNVGTPASLSNLPAVTVEGWVQLDTHTMYGECIACKTGGNGVVDYGLLIDDNPAGCAWWISSAVDATYGYRSIQTAGGFVPLSTWVHLAGSYDPTTNTRKIYVNGVEVAPDASLSFGMDVAAPMNEAGPVYLGGYNWAGSGATGQLDGRLDEIKIWRTIRTQADVCFDAGGTGGPGICDLSSVLP